VQGLTLDLKLVDRLAVGLNIVANLLDRRRVVIRLCLFTSLSVASNFDNTLRLALGLHLHRRAGSIARATRVSGTNARPTRGSATNTRPTRGAAAPHLALSSNNTYQHLVPSLFAVPL